LLALQVFLTDFTSSIPAAKSFKISWLSASRFTLVLRLLRDPALKRKWIEHGLHVTFIYCNSSTSTKLDANTSEDDLAQMNNSYIWILFAGLANGVNYSTMIFDQSCLLLHCLASFSPLFTIEAVNASQVNV
jgi:hypothetical protein